MADQNILIDLDALLDTRLGTIAKVAGGDVAAQVMEAGYWQRENDDFERLSQGKITNADFIAAYEQRDVDNVRNSLLTAMPLLLGPITRTLQSRQVRQLDVGNITVTLNTWPYELYPEEEAAFAESLAPYVSLNTRIAVVSLPLHLATPEVLVGQYDAWITYDLDAWLTAHKDTIKVKPIPEFTLIVPKIYYTRRLPTEEELRESDTNQFDPFKIVELAMLEWVAIEWQPVGYWSIIDPGQSAQS